jgi:hypothetical protein
VSAPTFLRLDMHLPFCFPLANPPREDIFNRSKKDLTRYNLLTNSYPLVVDGDPPPNPLNTVKIPKLKTSFALGGYAAGGVLLRLVGVVAENIQTTITADDTSYTVEWKAPNSALHLITPNPAELEDELKAAGATIARRRALLDVQGNGYNARLGGAELLVESTEDKLLSVVVQNTEATAGMTVACAQKVLLSILVRRFEATSDADRLVATRDYLEFLQAMKESSEAIEQAKPRNYTDDDDSEATRLWLEKVAGWPLGISMLTMGVRNMGVSAKVLISNEFPDELELPFAPLGLDKLPPNYYPHRSDEFPPVDYSASPLYQFDGGLEA